MKINELGIGSLAVLDVILGNAHCGYSGKIFATGLTGEGIPEVTASINTDQHFEKLPRFFTIKSLFVSDDNEKLAVFNDLHVERHGDNAIISSDSNNRIPESRDEERFEMYCRGMVKFDKFGVGIFPIKIKNLSKGGVAFYTEKDSLVQPGDGFELITTQRIPKEVTDVIGEVDGKHAVIRRVQEADYGRVLAAASFN